MSLYSQWQELINAHTSEAELRRFWDGYFKAETEAYKKILSAHKAEYAGREEELAQFFGMPAEIFIGFIDGINTSLRSELPLEEIEKDTEIKLDIDFEKLYFNMHEAKADWLYNLREWDGVLSSERRRSCGKTMELPACKEVGAYHSQRDTARPVRRPCPGFLQSAVCFQRNVRGFCHP